MALDDWTVPVAFHTKLGKIKNNRVDTLVERVSKINH